MVKVHRILLVDDHPIVREGLRGMLAVHRDLTVCGEASDGREAARQLEVHRPDAIVVDISLGAESGLDLIHDARARYPGLAILAVSMLDEMTYAQRALRAGANGYIMKQEATHQLVDALRKVLMGQTYVSVAVAERLLLSFGRPGRAQERYGIDRLTNRELQVFRLLGMGMSAAQIAANLEISIKTVETHRVRIKDKLGAENAMELVLRAAAWVREGRMDARD